MNRLIPAYSSLSVFIIGHGLLSTWVIVKTAENDPGSVWLGPLTASYFVGLILGSFLNCRLIGRVGHIRAFAAYTSLLSVIALLYGLFPSTPFWVLLRLLGGFATGGLVLVIESWILINSSPAQRGRVMAIYMCLFYGFLALGQFLMGQLPKDGGLWIGITASIATSLSVLPLATTSSPSPTVTAANPLSLLALIRLSPAGSIGSLTAGIMLGLIYGYFPAYLVFAEVDREQVGWMVATITLGGMALQYPLGRLSDRLDRRRLLLAMMGAAVVLTLPLTFFFGSIPIPMILGPLFLLGGVLYSIYPISVSHACDEVEAERLVSANQALLILYSLGSIGGPLLMTVLVWMAGSGVFFFAILGIALLYAAFLSVRLKLREAVPEADHMPFSAAPPMTPLAAELDPRTPD